MALQLLFNQQTAITGFRFLEMNLKNAQQFSKLAQRKHFRKLQWVFLLMLHNGNTSNENIGAFWFILAAS